MSDDGPVRGGPQGRSPSSNPNGTERRSVRAYHVVFSAYGFWLPNDPRGSNSTFVRSWRLLPFGLATTVKTRRSVANAPHDWALRAAAKRELLYPPVEFTGKQALAVAMGFGEVIAKTGCVAYACAILPKHVHMVISRHRYPIEQVINLLKGGATRRLMADGLHPLQECRCKNGSIPSPWGRNCRKVFLWTDQEIRDRIEYVERNPLKEEKRRQRWSFVSPFEG